MRHTDVCLPFPLAKPPSSESEGSTDAQVDSKTNAIDNIHVVTSATDVPLPPPPPPWLKLKLRESEPERAKEADRTMVGTTIERCRAYLYIAEWRVDKIVCPSPRSQQDFRKRRDLSRFNAGRYKSRRAASRRQVTATREVSCAHSQTPCFCRSDRCGAAASSAPARKASSPPASSAWMTCGNRM